MTAYLHTVLGHEVGTSASGARLTRQLCVFPSAPSVTRCARATSPQAGRI